MEIVFTFNSARRWKHAALLVAIAAVIALPIVLLALGVHPLFWIGALVPAWVAWRGVTYLSGGKEALVLDAGGMTRSGVTVPWDAAELELRIASRSDEQPGIEQVILWPPHRPDRERVGVGFDDSLDRFDEAVRALTLRIPEMRIRVSTATERDVRDGRREQLLGRYRPSAAERALMDMGRSALSAPPRLRN